jgi:hypothetical protein
MPTDLLVRMSQALRELPYDVKIEAYHGTESSYMVELHSKDGRFFGSGESPTSFVNAYTKAEKALRQAKADAEFEADYEKSINDFLAGTGRR